MATYQRHPLLASDLDFHRLKIQPFSAKMVEGYVWVLKDFPFTPLFQSSMNLRWRWTILFNQSGFQLDVSQGLSWMSLPFERN